MVTFNRCYIKKKAGLDFLEEKNVFLKFTGLEKKGNA